MRKITRDSINAFLHGRRFSRGNMTAAPGINGHTLRLHGHTIAVMTADAVILSDCGWQTTTTKERLNGLLEILGTGARIYQRDFAWYINGEDWHGGACIDLQTGVVTYLRPSTGDVIEIPAQVAA